MDGTALPAAGGFSLQEALAAADKLIGADRPAQALDLLQLCLQLSPDDAGLLDRAAICHFRLGEGHHAVALMERLTETAPGLLLGWAKLAAMRQSVGDAAGAAEGFRRALKIDPHSVNALAALNRLEPFKRSGMRAARLKSLLRKKKLGSGERAMAHSALALIERRAGNWDAAFRHFRLSNEACTAAYSPGAMDQRVADQLQQFRAARPAEAQEGQPRVVFVCGLPRSGTTLAETILLRHSVCAGIGESPALTRTLAAVRRHCGAQGGGTGCWDWCGQLDEVDIARFRALYFDIALSGRRASAPVLVDKMPMNCLDLGLAQHLLPGARFIFLSRHPMDVGLSNYATNFDTGNGFSRRLDWMGHVTRCTYRALHGFDAALGSQLRVQSYEALVRDPDAQIRAMLSHAGLAFEAACLSPEQHTGSVRTASIDQVREKINTSGLGKWHACEAQLAPLKDALGDAWIARWQAWDAHAARTGRLGPA